MSESHSPLQAAWAAYQARMDQLRQDIEQTDRFRQNPEHRAQAYHCLIEAQAIAYNLVMAPRQSQPRIYTHTALNTLLFSLGQNSGFCRYGFAMLDGRCSYRISGRLGGIKPLLAQLISPMLGDRRSVTRGNYELNRMADASGCFRITLSADAAKAPDIVLDRDSAFNLLFLRRWFADWDDDMGEMQIQIIDPPAVLPAEDEAGFIERLRVAADYASYLIREFTIGLYDLYLNLAGQQRGVMAYIGGESISNDLLGSPSTFYGLAVADCGPDQALIIEGVPPRSDFWSFQLGSVWSRPLDFVNAQTEINMQSVSIDTDGRYRVVVAHDDPGFSNWLSTTGHSEFVIVMRNYNDVSPAATVPPSITRVRRSALCDALPLSSARCSAGERARHLQRRSEGYVRLYH